MMSEEEFEDTVAEILSDCEECGHCTIEYHSTMCSNPDHRALAVLLLKWPSRVEDAEREDFEDQISRLEDERDMYITNYESAMDEIAEIKDKLRE